MGEQKIDLSPYFSQHQFLPNDAKNTFYQDLLDYAQDQPLQLLVIGKQKVGKTVFAKLLAEKMELEFVDLEKLVQDILAKIKHNQEEPQLDEEGNPLPFLNEVETRVTLLSRSTTTSKRANA